MDAVLLFTGLFWFCAVAIPAWRFWGDRAWADTWHWRFIFKPLAVGSAWAVGAAWMEFFDPPHYVAGSLAQARALALAPFVLGYGHFVFVFLLKSFEIFGLSHNNKKGDDQHRRGQRVIEASDLNRLTKRLESRFILGGVRIPREVEPGSFLFTGGPKSGKSQALLAWLDTLAKTDDRAIIADPSAIFLRRFWKEGALIFNPLDSRSVKWSPFSEFRAATYGWDADLIALALVPHCQGSEEEWRGYARELLADAMRALWEHGAPTNGELFRCTMLADVSELREKLRGTPSAALILAEGNEKMLGSVRTVAGKFLKVLSLLDPNTGADGWSMKNFVHETDRKDWLFLTFEQNRREMLKGLITAVLDVAASEILTLPEAANRTQMKRIWMILDEFPLLGAISGMKTLISNGSKHGFAGVFCMQSIIQMFETYGREGAASLLSGLQTQLILRCGDQQTAEAMSKHVGSQEVLRTNTSGGKSDSGTSQNWSQSVTKTDVLLPSEIQNFPDLVGVLNLAGDYPLCAVALEVASDVQAQCEAFMRVDYQRFGAERTQAQSNIENAKAAGISIDF